MKKMDKGLVVPKWLLIARPKIPQTPQSLSVQFVCPSPKVLDFNEKRLHWASAVRAYIHSRKITYLGMYTYIVYPLYYAVVFKFISIYCMQYTNVCSVHKDWLES